MKTHLVVIVVVFDSVQPLRIEHSKLGLANNVSEVGLERQHHVNLWRKLSTAATSAVVSGRGSTVWSANFDICSLWSR